MDSWFSIKILSLRSVFGSDAEKDMTKRTLVFNVEIKIEEKSLWKERTVIKEKNKISKYHNIRIANNSSVK